MDSAMDDSSHSSMTWKFSHWLTRKNTSKDPFLLDDWDQEADDDDDDMDEVFNRSMETEDPCTSTNELRIFVGTWNVAGRSPVGSMEVDLDEWLKVKDAADIYILGFQEIVPLKPITIIGGEDPKEAMNWNLITGKTLNDKFGCPWSTPMLNPLTNEDYQYARAPGTPYVERNRGSRYKLMASKKMVGVFISVWMRRALLRRYCISGVKVCSVACGIMGYLGNKGSVSVSMSIEGTSFCFVAAHLASGEKKGDEGRRNHQVSEIFRRTLFPRHPKDGDSLRPPSVLGHDQIFWFGDLNYRLYVEDDLARELILREDWSELQKYDQLRKELEHGGVFEGWKEGDIEFAPTYKYTSSNCYSYAGGVPNKGEKQRTPAWCDRILWYGEGVKQLSYFRSESKFSDHRPVSALFSTQIEVFKFTEPKAALQSIAHTSITAGRTNTSGDSTTTLFSLMEKDKEASPTYVKNFKIN